MEEEEKE